MARRLLWRQGTLDAAATRSRPPGIPHRPDARLVIEAAPLRGPTPRLPLPPPGREDATVLVARPMPSSEVEALLRPRASTQERGTRRLRVLLGGLAIAAVFTIVVVAGYRVALHFTGHAGYTVDERSID